MIRLRHRPKTVEDEYAREHREAQARTGRQLARQRVTRARHPGMGGGYRLATTGAVLIVATVAAVVSFIHIEHLALVHGQTPLAAWLLPVSIDGTVAAASMVMLRAARAAAGTPGLARFMLGLAVAATLACNVAYGLPYGVVGALISGWPAVAFIGSAEMAIGMVRVSARGAPTVVEPRKRARKRTPPKSTPTRSTVTPEHAEEKFANALADGQVPSLRQVKSELNVGTDRARTLRAHLEAVNGTT